MSYQSFHETLEAKSLGDAVSAMLPKGYTECDAVLQAKDVTADGEADAEGDHSIYARFTGQLAGTLPPPSEADVERYYAAAVGS